MNARLSIIYIYVILCVVSTPHGLHYERVKIKPVIVKNGKEAIIETGLPIPKEGRHFSGFT